MLQRGMAQRWALVLVVGVAGCGPSEPTPSPGLPPAPVNALPRRNTTTRAKLDTGDKLPAHGMVLAYRGFSNGSRLTLDADAGTLRLEKDSMGKVEPREREVSREEISEIMALGEAAWREIPSGTPQVYNDYRQELYVLDGEDAFWVVGNPLEDQHGAPVDRPAASAAVTRLNKAAP